MIDTQATERGRDLYTMMLAQATHTVLNKTARENCHCTCFYIVERCVIVPGEPEVVAKPDFDGTPAVRCSRLYESASNSHLK